MLKYFKEVTGIFKLKNFAGLQILLAFAGVLIAT
jgi:hypothetical protein